MANQKENVSITDNQNSITESQIISDEIVHSTPVPTKRTVDNDMVKIMQMLLNEKFNKLDIRSVSYTHLDVYKRQGMYHVKLLEVWYTKFLLSFSRLMTKTKSTTYNSSL